MRDKSLPRMAIKRPEQSLVLADQFVRFSAITVEPTRRCANSSTPCPSHVEWKRQSLEIAMPTYRYRCHKCGKKFETSETISEHETSKAKCPKCGSRKVVQIPGNVFVVTSKKS
jgi:putative FmdB family regulatory protein